MVVCSCWLSSAMLEASTTRKRFVSFAGLSALRIPAWVPPHRHEEGEGGGTKGAERLYSWKRTRSARRRLLITAHISIDRNKSVRVRARARSRGCARSQAKGRTVALRDRAPRARVRARALGVATPARFLNETPTVSRTEASTCIAVAPEARRAWIGASEERGAKGRDLCAGNSRGIHAALPSSFIEGKRARGRSDLLSNPYFVFSFLLPMKSTNLTSRREELSRAREFLEFFESSRSRTREVNYRSRSFSPTCCSLRGVSPLFGVKRISFARGILRRTEGDCSCVAIS